MRDSRVQDILKKFDKDLLPDPYLMQKVWTEAAARKGHRREIFFWRGLSLASLALVAFMGIQRMRSADGLNSAVPLNNPIVFHIENDSGVAYENVQMEMEIPEGVVFHTADPEINKRKSLRLNAGKFDIGKSRLPFVVEAKTAGIKQFKIHVFDENDNLIKEKTLTIQFSKEGRMI